MKCPKCGYTITTKKLAQAMGAKGGKAKGPQKARTSEQASAAGKLGGWPKGRPRPRKTKSK